MAQRGRATAQGSKEKNRGGVGPYSETFEPAFRRNEHVELVPLGETYRVRGFIPQPGVDVTLSVGESGQLVDEIQMPTDMMAQLRLMDDSEIPDSVAIEVDQDGRNSMLYSTKNDRGEIGTDTPALTENANLTELYQYEDRDLYFSVIDNGASESEITLTFSGFNYLLTSDQEQPSGGCPWMVPMGPIRPDKQS